MLFHVHVHVDIYAMFRWAYGMDSLSFEAVK